MELAAQLSNLHARSCCSPASQGRLQANDNNNYPQNTQRNQRTRTVRPINSKMFVSWLLN